MFVEADQHSAHVPFEDDVLDERWHRRLQIILADAEVSDALRVQLAGHGRRPDYVHALGRVKVGLQVLGGQKAGADHFVDGRVEPQLVELLQELRVRFGAVVGDEEHSLVVRLKRVHDFHGAGQRVVHQPQHAIAVRQNGVERLVEFAASVRGHCVDVGGGHHRVAVVRSGV